MNELLNNYKKIMVLVISVVVAFSIFCISVVTAYADDEEVQLTQEQIDFINNSNDIEDAQIRALATSLAATSTYSVDDIYNLLVSVRRAVGTQYAFATTNASLEATVNAIQQELLALGNPNSPSSGTILDMLSTIVLNTGGNNAFTMANSVNSILEAIGYDFASGTQPTNTLYDTLVYCEQMLASGLFDNNATPYLSLINGNITALGTSASYIYNALRYTEPNGDINTAGKYLYDIAYYISPICEMLDLSIEPNVANMNNTLTHIDSDIHTMQNWLQDTFYIKGTEPTPGTEGRFVITDTRLENCYISSSSYGYYYLSTTGRNLWRTTSSSLWDDFYAPYMTIDQLISSQGYFALTIPEGWTFETRATLPVTLNLNLQYAQNDFLPPTGSSNTMSGGGIVAKAGSDFNLELISVSEDKHMVICRYNIPLSEIPSTAKYVALYKSPSTQIYNNYIFVTPQASNVRPFADGYDIRPYLMEYQEGEPGTPGMPDKSYFELWRELYASDDLVAAKEAQQPLEDQVLEDFTGNGSASVTTSDATDAKGISNALKNGLSTGASSGNALEVFDSASAFWGWFSQDNANYFVVNVPSNASPQPLLRSAPSEPDYSNYVWTDSVPDVLSSIDIETQDKINSDIGGEHR